MSTISSVEKTFSMENYWGFIWRRTNGLMHVGNKQKVKFTYGQEDGSGVTGYNTNGANYIDLGFSIGGTNGGYISRMKFTDKGMFPEQVNGSSSTFYTDGCWFSDGTNFVLFGGSSVSEDKVGLFMIDLQNFISDARSSMGAALSLKPLKEEVVSVFSGLTVDDDLYHSITYSSSSFSGFKESAAPMLERASDIKFCKSIMNKPTLSSLTEEE